MERSQRASAPLERCRLLFCRHAVLLTAWACERSHLPAHVVLDIWPKGPMFAGERRRLSHANKWSRGRQRWIRAAKKARGSGRECSEHG